MAVSPPSPGSQPLAGSTTVDLPGNSLTQWASPMQDVASGMRLPPEVAVSCPQSDIVGVLDRLEGLTQVQYCRHCLGVGQRCQCSAIPRQAPGPTSALWTPPTVSYVAMVSSTKTTASTSAAGVTHPSYLPPGIPPLEAMDTLLAPTTENLLATAGVGRGGRTRAEPQIPAAPGPHQTRPRMPQQQAPTPRGQEAMQATPYWQQVFPPRCTAPKPSATPSASQGHEIDNEGTDPPPEDPGNADGASQAVVSWMRCQTMWPQGGSKTSPTSSAAAGWPRWVPWTQMNGTWPSTSFWP